MKILAVETTSAALSAAVGTNEKIIASFNVNNKKNHSVSLMPLIKDMLTYADTDIKDIDYFACSAGPGSFTGLRIGAATVKGFALAGAKKIIAVPTLDAIAYNGHLFEGKIIPLIDARNNRAYTAIYECYNGELTRKSEYFADETDNILNAVKGEKVLFLGDGAKMHKKKIEENNFVVGDDSIIMPSAAAVCEIAFKNTDKAVDVDKFRLMYLQKSQAERELEKRIEEKKA